jgi:sec-independent protein translocase protein TatA
MPFGIGFPELIILLVVLLLVFGAKRLPEMGRSLGKGMREFKDGVSGVESASEPPSPSQLPAAPTSSPSASTPSASTPSAEQVQRDLDSLSAEEREAIAESLARTSERSAPESERETVS